MLKIEGLRAGYSAEDVLRGVSLEVRPGEVVALLGANGAGKSTLIRTILGLLKPRSGEISFDGHSLRGLRPDQVTARGIAVCPEGKRLFPKMTVRENLLMGAYLEKDARETERRMEECLKLFPQLQGRMGQLVGTMSGGEQSMVVISRALMAKPRMILLDEPSLGLSPRLVDETFAIIRRIAALGTTILVVEQNAWKSLQIAQRGYVLQKGEILLSGEASDLMANPLVRKAYLALA